MCGERAVTRGAEGDTHRTPDARRLRLGGRVTLIKSSRRRVVSGHNPAEPQPRPDPGAHPRGLRGQGRPPCSEGRGGLRSGKSGRGRRPLGLLQPRPGAPWSPGREGRGRRCLEETSRSPGTVPSRPAATPERPGGRNPSGRAVDTPAGGGQQRHGRPGAGERSVWATSWRVATHRGRSSSGSTGEQVRSQGPLPTPAGCCPASAPDAASGRQNREDPQAHGPLGAPAPAPVFPVGHPAPSPGTHQRHGPRRPLQPSAREGQDSGRPRR